MSSLIRTTVEQFLYTCAPARVIFGTGTREHLAAEAKRLGMSRVLIVHGPSHTGEVVSLAEQLGDLYAGAFGGARMHTPTTVTEEAITVVRECRADGVVAMGGGSATGLSKAIALRTDLPQIVLPTTYAGSEMTNILGETQDGVKTTLRDARVLPETVIYDVELTLNLPVSLSGVSGMNALAHAVEALYAPDGNPIMSLIACEGIRALHHALPRIRKGVDLRSSRTEALYGAWLCGMCLGSVAMALHHKLCHTLGGTFDLPHAETHAIVLPHVLAYNAPAVPHVIQQLRATLQTDDPAVALYELGRTVSDAVDQYSLQSIGMPADGIDHAAELALANPYWNPRSLDRTLIGDLLTRAFHGDAPKSTP